MGSLFKGPKTKQTTTNKLPGWVNQTAEQAGALTRQVGSQAYTPYTGQRVAPLTGNEQTAYALAGNTGAAQPYLNRANELFARGTERFTDADIGAYMNPYIKGALDPAAREIRQRGAMQRNQLMGQQQSRGAFGGGRATLMEMEQARNTEQTLGDLYGKGYAQAFESGANRWAGDRAAAAAGGANYLNLAASQNGLMNDDIARLMNTGSVQRSVTQAMADFDYGQFAEGRDWDIRNLNAMLQGLQGIRGSYDTTTKSTTKQSGGELGQIIGLAATAAGAYFSGGTSLLAGAGGAAGAAPTFTGLADGSKALAEGGSALWGSGGGWNYSDYARGWGD